MQRWEIEKEVNARLALWQVPRHMSHMTKHGADITLTVLLGGTRPAFQRKLRRNILKSELEAIMQALERAWHDAKAAA